MNLIPFRLSPHLIHYFFQEFEGSVKKYAGKEVKTIKIEPDGFIGKFIVSNLRKIDYPVKNISSFNLFIEMTTIKSKRWCSKQNLFKREDLSNSYVELPAELMEDVEEMLEDILRHNFYYYVLGYIKGDDGKVMRGIRQFMDEYSLWDYEFNLSQLSRLFYRMKNEGPATRLQNKGMYHVKYSGK
ncbi:hypothetical protein [Chryseobacterium sp. FH1]|uniref:hypothetical protein n=1 Tax=Chryseobacterium sp. FH1 TaxID=1233951 RepID=UPI0004E40617|nr:hypothetical protein [Chryseobacterium sp. FH1]KFC19355.1 hypothetical protein IO90_08600 [Chryseobacterium sp. FH1]